MTTTPQMLDPEGIEQYRNMFHTFGRLEAPDLASPMYAELSYGISLDDELIALAAQKRQGQPAPNVLFAAVQYLLLSGGVYRDHPLSEHYPIVCGRERPLRPAFPLFRDFCLTYHEELLELICTRGTQTNVVRRCTCLLPLFSAVARESGLPLALIDLGASGGANLNFDRYCYSYRRGGVEQSHWGRAEARVLLESELRGAGAMPSLADEIRVASRVGVDLNPIDLRDPDQVRWLRALIWPEHVERHQRLLDVAAEQEASPVSLYRGDGAELLPQLIAAAPSAETAALVVYATIALYQFGRERVERIRRTLCEASRARPIWLVAMEGSQPTRLSITRYREGAEAREDLGHSSPHGWWIEWAA